MVRGVRMGTGTEVRLFGWWRKGKGKRGSGAMEGREGGGESQEETVCRVGEWVAGETRSMAAAAVLVADADAVDAMVMCFCVRI